VTVRCPGGIGDGPFGAALAALTGLTGLRAIGLRFGGNFFATLRLLDDFFTARFMTGLLDKDGIDMDRQTRAGRR
jgi:hypothetical protein